MENKTVVSIETVIDYIEANLDGKLDLETVAEAVHYSKYHLHRMFTSTVGMTIHDYVQRRQLTEAAKLLAFSDRPIIEVTFICGYRRLLPVRLMVISRPCRKPSQCLPKPERPLPLMSATRLLKRSSSSCGVRLSRRYDGKSLQEIPLTM